MTDQFETLQPVLRVLYEAPAIDNFANRVQLRDNDKDRAVQNAHLKRGLALIKGKELQTLDHNSSFPMRMMVNMTGPSHMTDTVTERYEEPIKRFAKDSLHVAAAREKNTDTAFMASDIKPALAQRFAHVI